MRARPKILLCTSFEEAEAAFERYDDDVLGIISDVEFPRGGPQSTASAGAELARQVRAALPRRADHPALLATGERGAGAQRGRRLPAQGLAAPARRSCARCMLEHFGFGDFVFRLPDGTRGRTAPRPARARARSSRPCPTESLVLPRRAQPLLALAQGAHRVRPRRTSCARGGSPTTRSPQALRAEPDPRDRRLPPRAEPARSWPTSTAPRSTLVGRLLPHRRRLARRQGPRPGVRAPAARASAAARPLPRASRSPCRRRSCWAPTSSTASSTTTTCATSRSSATTTRRSRQRFLRGAASPRRRSATWRPSCERARWPLAVRSSSLLEDSQHQPFTGVYDTLMLREQRPRAWTSALGQLLAAIKRVYASTFSRHAKAYLRRRRTGSRRRRWR